MKKVKFLKVYREINIFQENYYDMKYISTLQSKYLNPEICQIIYASWQIGTLLRGGIFTFLYKKRLNFLAEGCVVFALIFPPL